MGQADGRAVEAHLEGIQTGVREAAEGDKGRSGELSCGGRVGGNNDVDGLWMGWELGRGRRAKEAAAANKVAAGGATAATAANKAAAAAATDKAAAAAAAVNKAATTTNKAAAEATDKVQQQK